MKIGLIGLGIMGKPMAKNLLKAGYDLTVSDLNQASVDEIVAAGAKAATNAEIGETCDVVLTMVPNSPQVKAVMLGEDGASSPHTLCRTTWPIAVGAWSRTVLMTSITRKISFLGMGRLSRTLAKGSSPPSTSTLVAMLRWGSVSSWRT